MNSSQRPPAPAAGFSLVEMMAAMLITVVAIMGIAQTFSLGTGFIDRYATARAALARASGQVEHVRAQVKNGTTLSNVDSASTIQLAPGRNATLRTRIVGVDDPADGRPEVVWDYYRVTASVTWQQAGVTDSLQIGTVMLQ